MLRTTIVALILGLPPAMAAADVYQWVDANGNTIYSDQPPQHLRNSVRKPALKPLRKRNRRDQENVRLLPDRERRLLAAMAAHQEKLHKAQQTGDQ